MAVYDLSRMACTIDGLTADPSNDGDFLTISSRDVVTTAPTMGGRSSIDVSRVVDRAASLTTGLYAGWHKLMGDLYRRQKLALSTGEFDGFPFAFGDPGNGDSVTGRVLITQEPEVVRAASQAPVVWSLVIREAIADYGAAL